MIDDISLFIVIMFIESICVKNGKTELLDLHQNRMDRTYLYHFGTNNPYRLDEVVEDVPANGTYKLRIVYDRLIRKVNHSLYIKPAIGSLQVVNSTDINYDFKFSDRSALKELYDQKNKKDDIIIVKNDLVSDSYYANLVFFDGTDWYTPLSNLLHGVRRQHLLSTRQIIAKRIKSSDIFFFESVGLINAMLDIGDLTVDIENVFI